MLRIIQFHHFQSLFSKLADFRIIAAILLLSVFCISGFVETIDHTILAGSKAENHECRLPRKIPRLCHQNGVCVFSTPSSKCCSHDDEPLNGSTVMKKKCSCNHKNETPGLPAFNHYRFINGEFPEPEETVISDSVIPPTGYNRVLVNPSKSPESPPPQSLS